MPALTDTATQYVMNFNLGTSVRSMPSQWRQYTRSVYPLAMNKQVSMTLSGFSDALVIL
jgi:hypothetical protein